MCVSVKPRYSFIASTPHPSPLPTSGERGFDGLIFCNT